MPFSLDVANQNHSLISVGSPTCHCRFDSCTRHSCPNSRVIAGVFSHETDSVTIQSRTHPHEGKRIGPIRYGGEVICQVFDGCQPSMDLPKSGF